MQSRRIKTGETMESNEIISGLVDCGYSEERAARIYQKYKTKHKIDDLRRYIETKLGIKQSEEIESYPLRDF